MDNQCVNPKRWSPPLPHIATKPSLTKLMYYTSVYYISCSIETQSVGAFVIQVERFMSLSFQPLLSSCPFTNRIYTTVTCLILYVRSTTALAILSINHSTQSVVQPRYLLLSAITRFHPPQGILADCCCVSVVIVIPRLPGVGAQQVEPPCCC